MNKDLYILQAVRSLELATIDDLAVYLGRNKKSLEHRLPKLVTERQLYRKRWASTEPFIYSVKDISRRSPFTVSHELMITAIQTALFRTELLLDWRQGKKAWKGAVHQDAFCTLKVGEKTLDVFIEADNGTMNGKDIEDKLEAYLSYFEQSSTPFKVLFVTTGQGRAKNLSKLAENTISQKKRRGYLFTTIERFKADPLGEICFVPYEDQFSSLLPQML